MARLQELYREKIIAELTAKFGYKSAMEVPRLTKITLNMGVSEAVADKKVMDHAVGDLTKIAGQKPVVTKAKKAIAGFKIREGQAIGCMVTLRGPRMFEFLDRHPAVQARALFTNRLVHLIDEGLDVALRIAVLPVVSYSGPLLADLLTGSFIVENLFQIPGLGGFLVNACLSRDYPLVVALVLLKQPKWHGRVFFLYLFSRLFQSTYSLFQLFVGFVQLFFPCFPVISIPGSRSGSPI